ncbi:MAG: hypothetical protein EHM12_08200 [Dehalococcoidia bacterium]|nr:MAG: hypothetical protein EHM12_08200 [Dehalococcoidia bacterium]
MKLNDVEMQYQLNEFKDEIMTNPVYQKHSNGKDDPDYIYEFGCNLVMKLNMYNLYNKGKDYMTIKQLNDKIKAEKGYAYLYWMDFYNGDIEKVKKKCLGEESFVLPEVINRILGIKRTEHLNVKYPIDITIENVFYGVRTLFNETGHYSMVVNNHLDYLDSYDGKIKAGKNILNLYSFEF